MSKLFYPKQLSIWSQAFSLFQVKKMIAVLLLTWAAMQQADAQCLDLTKTLIGVAPASSGIVGNIDVTYHLHLRNTCPITTSVDVFDEPSLPSNLGIAFIRVVGTPQIVSATDPMNAGTINPGYTGIAPNHNLTDGSGVFFNIPVGYSEVTYSVTYEVNPRIAGAPSPLNNQFRVSHGPVAPETIINSNIVSIPDCWTNCQLACNNQVQISVNSVCEAQILAAMILEGEYADCADLGFFEVTIYDGTKKVNLPLDQSYLNKKLKVNVRNIVCNNNCWGYMILEDKTPPALNCRVRDTVSCAANITPQALGFPVNTSFVDQSVYPYIVRHIDSCGIVYLTYQDSLVKYDCSNDSLSATIYRKWCARDPGGFTACCYDTIDLRRGTLADITLPRHYDGQPGNLPMLKCDGNWTKLSNGFPDTSPSGTGSPSGVFCGNIQYDFTDDTLQVCKGTYKLLRRWIILDWCNPAFRIDWIQQIKVVDDQPPLVTCPKNYTVNTNPWSCTGSLILPVPIDWTPTTAIDSNTIPLVIENCSGWTYYVKHLPATNPSDCTPIPGQGDTKNITKLADGRYRVDNMPLGCNWIYYVITDGCGNSTACQFDIVVTDHTPPVAVCQQKTVISLGSNGKAIVPAAVFNDRSHDNCGPVHFEVRRMDPGPCGTTTFKTEQEFCCADVSATVPVRVVLRVIDAAGNSSECMIDAFIQDKLPPKITCPKNVAVICGTDLSNLNVFGVPTATDNCTVRLETRVSNNLSSCNVGTIVREFVAIDNGGLRDSCTQIITVYDNSPFTKSDIVWPADILLTGCTDSPDPNITGKPTYKNRDACNQPISSHSDLAFNYVEGVCYKILRTWTVIDWCTYNPAALPNPTGVWYHTQVIKINNTEAPNFTSSCENKQYCIQTDCSVNVLLEATASDKCTPQDELRWTYQLDINNDGVGIITDTKNKFYYDLRQGVHRITWTVEDQCGNKSTCSYLITVVDCKQPTPYCLPGIVTVIMQNNGTVTIWAKDFNAGSSDNCTDKPDLRYSFSSDVNNISRVFTCADLANGKADTIEVMMFVTDLAGNQDFCRTNIILQDNQDACPDVPTFGNLGGAIRGYNQNPSPEVLVNVQSAGSPITSGNTNGSGSYVFSNLNMHKDYMLIPEFDKDPLNGISTKDIVKIQRHILGLEILDSPYKYIAADVNRSGSITARDVSELRKLILGIDNNFENNKSWNFVDANWAITADNFASYKNHIQLNDFNQNAMNVDFISVKTGDVTGEANTGLQNQNQASRSNHNLVLEVGETNFDKNELIKIPIRSINNDFSLNGLQFAMQLDTRALEFVAIESAGLEMDPSNYNVMGDGTIRLSWNGNQPKLISNMECMFYLVCQTKQVGQINYNTLRVIQEDYSAEAYTLGGDFEIAMVYRSNNNRVDESYELFQNIPNPFYSETNIYFRVPEEEHVMIGFYDISGKMLKSYEIAAKKGINTLKVKSEEFNSNGVLYYKLDADRFSSTRKMIILK